MVILSGRSAGVSAREIDLTGPRNVTPTGVPAGVIGTANQGPAFVPVTLASIQDYIIRFGDSDGTKFGPLAVSEWLRNAQSATFLRVLGIGKGKKRETTGNNAGRVDSAGFVAGQRLPGEDGFLRNNPYANLNGPLGRTHLLGCFMSASAGSAIFADAGIQPSSLAVPIIRGVMMAPSGVVPMLSSSFAANSSAPGATLIATTDGPRGAITGSVDISAGLQTFVLLLNGHKGTDPSYPNVITASFDQTAPNYFGSILNTDPFKIEQAGHYLYARYDVHPSQAVVTGTGITSITGSSPVPIAFLTTGSTSRDLGTSTVPNYENFEDRFTTPATPSFISQKFGGKHRDLFRVHLLSDGREGNDNFKVSIQNIAASNVDNTTHGTFDLIVRDFSDNDENRVAIESFAGLNLNPESDNYIARRIGDMRAYYDFDKGEGSQKLVVDGKFVNKSNLIRVEVDPAVDSGEVDPTALPIGFRGPFHLVTSGTNPLTSIASTPASSSNLTVAGSNALKRAVEPPVPYRDNITVGQDPKRTVNTQLYWGVQFEQKVALEEPNRSRVSDKSIASYIKYFPRFHTTFQNVSVGENSDTPDVAGTVLDSDRFNNNLFSLDRIRIRTGSNGLIDAKELVSATYIRHGMIDVDADAKTRALSMDDFADLSMRTFAKFSVFVQGGFDGTNIFNRDADDLTNAAVKQEMDDPARGQADGPTVSAYKRALDIMGNVSDVDVKLLAVPGIRHSIITDKAINIAEDARFDAIYIMDIEERDTLNQVVTSSAQDTHVANTANGFSGRGLDSNFAAAYFPDVIMQNPFNGLNAQVPPSVVVLGAFALNDAVAFPWFAPAGFTRGALQTTERATLQLNRSNLDTLQDADINPLTSVPSSDGVVVWGQKTLQAVNSALDRVNVRRLMIELRRQVRAVANTLLFEPNRVTTLERFSALVNPILTRIQEQQGLNRFKVLIDTTTTTEADVLNNTIRGKIFVEPTRTAELVSIDFVVANPGQVDVV